jgi:hypothetical protein
LIGCCPIPEFTASKPVMHRSRHGLVAMPLFGVHMARALTLALLLLLSTPSAFGQYVAVIAACTRDVTKFCHAATPQQNFLAECIESHFQDFHERCRAALLQTAPVREACRADIAQQCHAARPGGGRILLCMKKHFAALGQSCRDAIGHAAELKVGSY